MAIAAGDYVSPRRDDAAINRYYQGGKVFFGVCDAVAGANRTILWMDGRFQAGIAQAVLDEIVAPLATNLVGKVVELDIRPVGFLQPSSSYDATVVACYRRDLSGSGSITDDLVLAKLLISDQYFELPAAQATVLDDR
jgi:hypothetical protein